MDEKRDDSESQNSMKDEEGEVPSQPRRVSSLPNLNEIYNENREKENKEETHFSAQIFIKGRGIINKWHQRHLQIINGFLYLFKDQDKEKEKKIINLKDSKIVYEKRKDNISTITLKLNDRSIRKFRLETSIVKDLKTTINVNAKYHSDNDTVDRRKIFSDVNFGSIVTRDNQFAVEDTSSETALVSQFVDNEENIFFFRSLMKKMYFFQNPMKMKNWW